MISPAQVGQRLLLSLAAGAQLGLLYSFLRPIRSRQLKDLLLLPALVYAWLWVGFAVCRGDLRLGYYAPMAAGAWASAKLASRWLGPFFGGFWGGAARLRGWIGEFFLALGIIFRKKAKKYKKYLSIPKKIEYNKLKNYRNHPQSPRRKRHGKSKQTQSKDTPA